jgi:hypothetical protein
MNLIKSIINRGLFRIFGYQLVHVSKPKSIRIVEASDYDLETIVFSQKYSMQSQERLWALINATRYIVSSSIPGVFVECGVYRGGSAIAIARTLMNMGCIDRDIYLFDTFDGMTNPSDADFEIGSNISAKELLANAPKGEGGNVWAHASSAEVLNALITVGYPQAKIHLVVGDVAQTLKAAIPKQICLLRLDTDWYESTRIELERLVPQISKGGVMIIDDFGHWDGARRAVTEYLKAENINRMLQYIDYTGRLIIF